MRSRMLLLLLLASCSTPPPAPLPAAEDVPWLALDLPEVVRSSVPLVEFQGRVAAPGLANADVVLVIDLTNTTLAATGVDSDGDGTLGVDRPWAKEDSRSNVRWQRPARSWTSDFDDAIVSVELESARRLLDALAERHCRVGVITFTSKPSIRAEVGAPAAARAELDKLRVSVDRSGTEARTAILRAGRLLDESPTGRGARRRPAVVFLSDGAKTNRQQDLVLRNAERAAEELAERGITLHALGFGPDEKEKPGHMSRIAAFGRGRYLHVDYPDEALALVAPHLGIADLPVINRARDGLGARALRSFPDGSFDGFVPLAPGENRIEFEVVLDDGRRARAERTLHYEPTDAPSAADEALLEALRGRTAETEIAGESQAGARRRSTSIEIRGEPR